MHSFASTSATERPSTKASEIHGKNAKEISKGEKRGIESPSAEDIKLSKDRINAMRNTSSSLFSFKSPSHDSRWLSATHKLSDSPCSSSDKQSWIKEKSSELKSAEDDEEKDKCEGSDTESVEDIANSFVLSRIANYESSPFSRKIRRAKERCSDSRKKLEGKGSQESSEAFFLKESHKSPTNHKLSVDLKTPAMSEDDNLINKSQMSAFEMKQGHENLPDNVIQKIKSQIEDLEAKKTNSNVIFENKEVLKLLSNKHRANLNIRVEKNPHIKNERISDNKWRDALGSFRASKQGVRSSFRSSRKRKKNRRNNINKDEEKGASDSTMKENESEVSDSSNHLSQQHDSKTRNKSTRESPYEYIKKRFPEYAKLNKKGYLAGADGDIPPRSLSTSPIERAPVVKKICSSGTRLKKDTEPTLNVNPVKKKESFRGSKTCRRNSITYFPKTSSSPMTSREQSFVQAQATRLRRKNSRSARRSEYRVSVTIRPSIVAELANKFNTIILQNQNESGTISDDFQIGRSFEETGPKKYRSPRASFKRKYRHKAAKAAKEHKPDENLNANGTESALSSTRRSLSNSLAELNMKDLFDDCFYNKTDEEKVCEKLKTALSSGKFKGETDDSEDDLSFKKSEKEINDRIDRLNNESEADNLVGCSTVQIKGVEEDLLCKAKECNFLPKGEFDLESEVSPHQNKSEYANHRSENNLLESLQDIEICQAEVDSSNINESESKTDDFASIETNKSIDSGISSMQTHTSLETPDETNTSIQSEDKDAKVEGIPRNEEGSKSDLKNEKTDLNSEDSHSEISSICSDAKARKKTESSIYTSLKGVVKNTVKKTKEKDAGRKDTERERRNRSPSQERDKWYKRGRSKERKPEKQVSKESKGGTLKRDGKLYELWPFKKFREKSQERPKEKGEKQQKNQDVEDKEDELQKDPKLYEDLTSSVDQSDEGAYAKLKFASRSRTREKKVLKKQSNFHSKDKSTNEIPELVKKDGTIAESKKTPEDKPEQMKALSHNPTLSTEDDSLYGPVAPMSSKTLPPPPKTPIPSPPNSFKKFLLKRQNSPIKPAKGNNKSKSSPKKEGPDSVYENMHSPDIKRFQKTKLKLERKGIKPNSSFLWSETAQASALASLGTPKVTAKQGAVEYSEEQETNSNASSSSYDKIALPEDNKDESSEGHNYTEIQNNSSGDSQTGYDEIGSAASTVSYDEIGAPHSCMYDASVSPSNTIYDSLKPPSESYDPVIPPKSDSSQYDECEGVVKAHLAVVKEYQTDTFSYLYDDIALYNASQLSHSYEPVCPPDDIGPQQPNAVKKSQKAVAGTKLVKNHSKLQNECLARTHNEVISDDSENEAHEVFSYKLTAVGKPEPNNKTNVKKAATSSPKFQIKASYIKEGSIPTIVLPKEACAKAKKKPKKAASQEFQREFCYKAVDEADEWTDIEEQTEEKRNQVVLVTKVPLSRLHIRHPRRQARVYRKTWSQVVRDMAARTSNTHSAPVSFSRISSKTIGRHPATGAETENDDDAGGHYEAIYEVINPSEETKQVEASLEDDLLLLQQQQQEEDDDDENHLDDLDANDSFESDDSDDAYTRLHPLNAKKRLESFSSDISSEKDRSSIRKRYSRSQSYQPHSINKIAEAANLGMKRLRRNWSLTKNEVKTGLNRIKKKGTFTMSDMKSSENLYEPTYPQEGDKTKWSLKNRFRRKSISSSTLPSMVGGASPSEDSSKKTKESPTFYLTLTIASDGQEGDESTPKSKPPAADDHRANTSNLERRKSNSSSVSSVATTTSCETTASCRSRPHSTSGTNLLRNTSSKSIGGPSRPKTAPPAPPPLVIAHSTEKDDSDYETANDITKDQLAIKLNQLLSSGPTAPPGRRVLKTSDDSSSDSSPVPVKLPLERSSAKQMPYTLKHSHTSPSSLSLPPELSNSALLSLPQNRSSIVSSSSHGSSEGYILFSDIASHPPPLPARPTSGPVAAQSKRHSQPLPPPTLSVFKEGDSATYLDFTCNPPDAPEEPTYMSSHFADEPLYQFYTAKVERAALLQGDYSSEDDYEVINDGSGTKPDVKQVRPSAMEIVTPTDGRRTLWCELPEVVSSGILSKISTQERKLQEAMFEVITSEASYLKSLNILVNHFMNCPLFDREEDPVITSRERKVLFSDIIPVKKSSELFLEDLEKRWQESFEITSITDIILRHSTSSMVVYVKYCSNQIYQERMLRNLKENNPRFVDVLTRLESSPICQSLAMHSFLMLPMQRVTRLPLLLDAIFNRLEYGSPQWEECKTALASITKIVAECNEGARKMERMEEMLLVSRQLDFREVKGIPLISASRWLVKKGELTRLTWRESDAKLTFGRKISKHCLYFFLFSDLLVVTKKKSEDMHTVLDYCPRNMVQVIELESADKFPGRLLDGHKNLIIMTMLQNHENRTVEMVLSCPRESDRTRWMQALTPRISDNPDERIYEEWDCPQVQVTHAYASIQPDELSLEVSDVINVLKKTSDGWYQGERLRDGERGWFPGNHTAEIASAHVRARNLRQRYRLLAISGSFVDELKKEKERIEKEEKRKERRRTIIIKEVL